MKRLALFLTVCIAVSLSLIWLWQQNQAAVDSQQLQPGETRTLRQSETSSPQPSYQPYAVESVAEGLTIPWDMIFTSTNRILVSERTGSIQVIENDQLLEVPLLRIDEVSPIAEAGLMGLALHPDYESNKQFYACYAYESEQGLRDKIVLIEDNTTSATIVGTIIDNIPAARFHAGCQLAIGPDNKLYVTTGDATQPDLAQDQNSLAGKILRLELDGSIPSDNPFSESPVFSLGHRNPQGIDWHPVSNELVATEHGPSGNDGPPGGDEVNLIVAAGNYGWPEVSHTQTDPEYNDPLLVFTPAEAPASGLFYSGTIFPQWTNTYFFGALRGEGIIISDYQPNTKQINTYEKLPIEKGRIRAVVESPDGLIYFSTSNQDGRGEVNPGDDHIFRIIPTTAEE